MIHSIDSQYKYIGGKNNGIREVFLIGIIFSPIPSRLMILYRVSPIGGPNNQNVLNVKKKLFFDTRYLFILLEESKNSFPVTIPALLMRMLTWPTEVVTNSAKEATSVGSVKSQANPTAFPCEKRAFCLCLLIDWSIDLLIY